jgi:hypothetical protein
LGLDWKSGLRTAYEKSPAAAGEIEIDVAKTGGAIREGVGEGRYGYEGVGLLGYRGGHRSDAFLLDVRNTKSNLPIFYHSKFDASVLVVLHLHLAHSSNFSLWSPEYGVGFRET